MRAYWSICRRPEGETGGNEDGVNGPRTRGWRLGRTLEERGEKEDGLKAAWRTRAEGRTRARLRLGKTEVAGSKKRRTRRVGR